jgi:hypothetical protein
MASTFRTFPEEFPATPSAPAVPVDTSLTRCTLADDGQPETHEVSVAPGDAASVDDAMVTVNRGAVALEYCAWHVEAAKLAAA